MNYYFYQNRIWVVRLIEDIRVEWSKKKKKLINNSDQLKSIQLIIEFYFVCIISIWNEVSNNFYILNIHKEKIE